MKQLFWKIVLSIKYWRVLLKRPKSNHTETTIPGRFSIARMAAILLLLTPVFIGLGFGYLAIQHARTLSQQASADERGIPVLATIEELREETNRRVASRPKDEASKPTCYYVVVVSYSPPDSPELFHKTFEMDEDAIYRNYKLNDKIRGTFLAEDPNVFFLDEHRLGAHWFWICLSVFCLFTVFPLVLVVNAFIRRRVPRGKSWSAVAK